MPTLDPGAAGVVFACGAMVAVALDAAATLELRGRSIAIVNMHTIKPLDADTVVAFARGTGAIVMPENHSIIGGLGSAVAEALMKAGVHAGFAWVGVRDTFAEGGSTPFLFEKYGLTAGAIVAAFNRMRGQA